MTEKCLIGSLHDFPQGEVRASMLADGTVVAVFNVEGNVYVTADRCTHGEASLSDEGKLCGRLVECPWHYGTFDVTTGAVLKGPARRPLRTYRVVVDGEVGRVE